MEYRTCPPGGVLSIKDNSYNLVIHGCPFTSVGMVRGNNEDSVQIWSLDDTLVGIVADGMGGAAGGEEASSIAVKTIEESFIQPMPDRETLWGLSRDDLGQKLRDVLSVANKAVLDKAEQNQELEGMGTTATMVILRGTEGVFAHIGDSRAYHVIGETKEIKQITSDHSFVEALVASGHLTQEQAEVHPLRNVLYRALGQPDETPEDVDIYFQRFKSGDRLILCSDGLPRHLKDQDIADIALKSEAPETIANQLVDLANARGGEDNVSAVVFFVTGDS